jgi:hypothetical protein
MKPVDFGANWNFFVEYSRTDGYSVYQPTADVVMNVKYINSFSLVNESISGTGKVYYSWNGLSDAGSLTMSTPTQAIIFDYRRPTSAGLWFKSPTGPIQVRVEAWCNS